MHSSKTIQSRRGFTLVEIMIVIAIVMIVMGLGVPSMLRAFQRNDLARAVNDIIEGCKTARDRAILQGIPYDFVLSASGEMNIAPAPIRDAVLSPTTEQSPLPSTAASGFPRKLGEDVMIQLIDVNFVDHMQAEEARVRFYPNGISEHFTIVLNWQGKQRTITLDVVTGIPEEITPQ